MSMDIMQAYLDHMNPLHPAHYCTKVTRKDYADYCERADEVCLSWAQYFQAQTEWFALTAQFKQLQQKWGVGKVWSSPDSNEVARLCDAMRDIEFYLEV